MLRYIGRRCFSMIFVLFGVSLLVFMMVHLIPGDPALMVAGMEASEEQVEKIRESLGLDRPYHIQYLDYMSQALMGDMGRSIHSRKPVAALIREFFPVTFELTTASIAIASLIGIMVGVVSAVRQYSLFDYLSMVWALTGISMPIFWIGLLLMWFFSIYLGWLPTGGWDQRFWSLNGLRHAVLPVLTLSGISVAMIARLTRSTMLEVIRQDYITTARAKGVREVYVIYLHALRNALIPVVTYMGLQYGILLGGAVVTEQIFSIPGIGRLLVQAVYDRDYPVIQGCILFIAMIFIIINLVVDLLYGLLDPRIRYE
jgi:peptide/nickel transport system permease protein